MRIATGFVVLSALLWLQPLLYTAPRQLAVDADANAADIHVNDFRMSALETGLSTMPVGPERDYFAGVLAGRSGHAEESIVLLNRALPSIRESSPHRAAIALETLADDYNMVFRYGEAARAYDDLAEHFAGQSDHDLTDDAALAHLLSGVPAQTIAWQGPVRLKTERNRIGSLVTELTVNGVHERWLLDTGAGQSVVSRSFAQRLGITPLPGVARASGFTGAQSPFQVAVLPMLQLSGATLHNVVVLIIDDANLKITAAWRAYQVNAVLGYPVFQALGRVTFRHDGEFLAGDAAGTGATATRMYTRGIPVIESDVQGRRLPFSFDTGAFGTHFTVKYYEQFRSESKSWRRRTVQIAGLGGRMKLGIYRQPNVLLNVGDSRVVLKDVSVFPRKMNEGIDRMFGNLGMDVVAAFDSVTLDFSNMMFSLGAPISDRGKK